MPVFLNLKKRKGKYSLMCVKCSFEKKISGFKVTLELFLKNEWYYPWGSKSFSKVFLKLDKFPFECNIMYMTVHCSTNQP